MIRSVTQPCRCCQGIQWGIARMSIVASTGSPSIAAIQQHLQRADRLVVAHVLIDGQRDAGHRQSRRSLWPAPDRRPAAFGPGCRARGPACRRCSRITSNCTSGGTAMSTTSTARVGQQLVDNRRRRRAIHAGRQPRLAMLDRGRRDRHGLKPGRLGRPPNGSRP